MPGYYDLGGTIRARDASETLAWLARAFPRCGLTRIARVTGLDHVGIAVSMAVRPLARTLSVSQGKGTSPELADVSAAMESIELWHAENAPAARLSGSFAELSRDGHTVVDPSCLRPEAMFPNAVDLRTRATAWLEAKSLVSRRTHFIPRYLCALATDEPIAEYMAIYADSTGLAGGNTLEEATCHALSEIIERDATGRFEASSSAEQTEREIDVSTVSGPAACLLEKLDAAGIAVRIWEQTSHVGVPSFGCMIERVGELRGLTRFGGFGAHLDPEIAVCRAVSEAAQSRLTIIAGARDDQPPESYASMQLKTVRPLSPSRPRRSFANAPKRRTTGDFASDAQRLVDSLLSAGFVDAFRVNLTHPDLGVPVVFVFVPNAELATE